MTYILSFDTCCPLQWKLIQRSLAHFRKRVWRGIFFSKLFRPSVRKKMFSNLFVTSKIEFSNSSILEFKVLHKSQRVFYNPFLMMYQFLFITLRNILSLIFLILKAFCSTLNSRIGELEDWRIGEFDFCCHELGKLEKK